VVSRGNVSSMIGVTNILQLGGLAHAHCNYIRFEFLDAPSWSLSTRRDGMEPYPSLHIRLDIDR